MDDETLKGNNESNPQTEYVVTRWYRCPELLLSPNRPYSTAIDLWSVGCIMAELIRRKPLFPGKSHANQVQLIFEVLGYSHPTELGFPISAEATSFLNKRCKSPGQDLWDVIPEASEEAICFIAAMLDINPKHRPTASQALDLPYMMDADIVCDYSNAYCEPPKPGMFKFERQKLTTDELKELIHVEVFSSTPGDSHNDEATKDDHIKCSTNDEDQEPRPCVQSTRQNKIEPKSAIVPTEIVNATTAACQFESRADVVKDAITNEVRPKSSSSNIFAAIGAAAISAMAGDRKISPRAIGKSPRAAIASSSEAPVNATTSVTTNKTVTYDTTIQDRRETKSEVTFSYDAFSSKFAGPLAAEQSSAEAVTVARGHISNTIIEKYRSVASHSEKGITDVPEPEVADVEVVAHHSDDKSSATKFTEQETNETPRDGWFPKKQIQHQADPAEKGRFNLRTKNKSESYDEKGSVSFMQSLRSKLTNNANRHVLLDRDQPTVGSTETDTISQRSSLPLLRPLSSMFSGLSMSGNKLIGPTGTRSDHQLEASVRSTHAHSSHRGGPADDGTLPYVKELDHNPDQYSSAIDTDHSTRPNAFEKKHAATVGVAELPKLSSGNSNIVESIMHDMVIEDVTQRCARALEPISLNNAHNSESSKLLSTQSDSFLVDQIGCSGSLSSGENMSSPPSISQKQPDVTRHGSFVTSQNSTMCTSERSLLSDVTDHSTSNSSREHNASMINHQCMKEQTHFEGMDSIENTKNSLLPNINR